MKGSVAVSWGLLLLCALHACALGHLTAVHAGSCPIYPFRIGIVCTKNMTKVECNDDSTCASDQKCCGVPICTTKCVKAVTEKSGSCPQPPSYPKCVDLIVKPANSCSTDQQCLGQEKCCYYGCSLQCKQPLQEKLGSCQDFDRAICLFVRPLPDECESDSQCPGAARCCCQSCRKACSETVKSGICPVIEAMCMVTLPEPKCKNDSGCPGRQKCCSFCGEKCLDPVPENPGICPVDPQIENQCGFLLPPLCSRDAACAPNEKCCRFGCRVQCVKALTAKSGVCPNILVKCKVPLDPPQCQSDGDCLSNKKCCNQCGNKCSNPELVHDGFCPAAKPVKCDAKYMSECSRDSGCRANEKCCDVGCRMACVKSVKEKSGSCPFIHLDELSEDMCNKCNNDGDCPGNEKCCAGAKGRECQDPQPGILIVKDGECPRRINWCDFPPPYLHKCDHDGNCPGGQKCCIQICTRECLDAVPVKPHPGTCPPDEIRCIQAEDDQCKIDSDCKEDEKCCHNHCGLKCVPAVPVHAGSCPIYPFRIGIVCIKNITKVECNDDSTCTSDEKCCGVPVCTTKCVKAVTVHAGSCPTYPGKIGIVCTKNRTTVECKDDSTCASDEKCCGVPVCTTKCVKAVTEKTGVCPKPSIMCDLDPLPRHCNNDGDCPGPQKCCTLACSIGCTDPSGNPVKPHPGTCPPDTIRCIRAEEDQCKIDSDCKEDEKCCHNRCGLKCVPAAIVKPKSGICPVDTIVCIQKEDDQCKIDSDCKGHKKCCYNRCGLKCVDAVKEKAGQCPVPTTVCAPVTTLEEPKCTQDSDCTGAQKCCIPLCERECTDPIAEVKSGECPKDTVVCKQAEPDQCNKDGDCPREERCCYFHCGLKCKAPETVKPGQCPIPITRCATPLPPPECQTDSDCPEDEKCCTPVCTQQCTKIVPDSPKPGTCPPDPIRCSQPADDQCKCDSDCKGNDKCCHNHCGLKCVTALPVTEKDGSCPLPPSYPTCKTFPTKPKDQCATDLQCPEDEKCCEYGCSLKCKKPLQDKLGSCPDFNRSICLYARPAPAECSEDDQCPGTQRCCCHGACRMECAETVPDKRGICPRILDKCKLPLAAPECEDDRGCKGKKKCCFLCGWKCIPPAENPGYCPVELEKEAQCGYQQPPQCNSDSDCALNEKCCMFGCGVQCVKALAAKPGMCPAILAKCRFPYPEPECQTDGDCVANKKCCQLCGKKCIDAVQDHEGVCPSYINVLMACPASYSPSCNYDWNCAEDEKCCNAGCKRECVKALKEKMGFCPDKVKYTDSADRCDKCNTDKDCPGMERCCAGVKGRECIPPLMFTGLLLPTAAPGTKG